MSKRVKEVLLDSDSESPDLEFCNHVSSSRGGKKGIKRGRAVSFSGSTKKGKSRKDSTRKQRILSPDSSDEDSSAPLTRGDIPAIVSAVLTSLHSCDTQQSRLSELDDPPLPGKYYIHYYV